MLPYVILHNAVSVDGRMDWITPDLEQFYGLTGEFEEDATLAGCETMLKAYSPEQITESSKEIPPPPEKRPDDEVSPWIEAFVNARKWIEDKK